MSAWPPDFGEQLAARERAETTQPLSRGAIRDDATVVDPLPAQSLLPPPVPAPAEPAPAPEPIAEVFETAELEPVPVSVQGGRSRLEALGRRAWAVVGIGLVLLGLSRFVGQLGWVVFPAVVAILFGTISAPLVNRLQQWHFPRLAGAIVVFLGLVAILGGLLWAFVPPFSTQVTELSEQLPNYADDLASSLESFETDLRDSSPNLADAVATFRERLSERAAEFGQDLADTILGVVGTAVAVGSAMIIGTVIAFLAVKDLPVLTRNLTEWLDKPRNRRLGGALRQMKQTLTFYIRGQLLVSLIIGILSGAAFALIGVPYYLPLGAVSAVGNLIPGLGPIVAGVPAVLLAATDGGFATALWTAVALVVIQQGEANLVSPRLVGTAVNLHPVVVIGALTLGGGLFGLPGLLVAVPLVAIARDGLDWFFYTPEEVDRQLARARLTPAERRALAREEKTRVRATRRFLRSGRIRPGDPTQLVQPIRKSI